MASEVSSILKSQIVPLLLTTYTAKQSADKPKAMRKTDRKSLLLTNLVWHIRGGFESNPIEMPLII